MIAKLFMMLVSISSIALGYYIMVNKKFVFKTGQIATGELAIVIGGFFFIIGVFLLFYVVRDILKS